MPRDESTERADIDPASVGALAREAGAIASRAGRDDLAARLETIAGRVERTDTVVCVVGEFKKGKSALINALLARPVCPVDDDFATMAVTVVRYADPPGATVRRREDGQLVVESIAADEIAGWVAEPVDADRRRTVELVEVGLRDPFLERGVTLVDTPGVGGLNAGHAAATLAFLPSADALVFVTDASAELSGPELEFLASALKAGPPILVAVTKIDMYPEWRRIVAIDETHLRSVGLVDPPFGLSSVLRANGHGPGDPVLERESGIPVFAEAIVGDVVGRARSAVVSAAAAGLRPAIDQLREPLAAELTALERPETAERMAAELRDVRARLANLTGTGAAWSVRLEDEFAALRSRIEFGFAGRVRQILRDAQEEVERIDPGRAWPEFSQRIQAATAGAVRAAFLEATDGAAAIQAMVAGLLTDEEVGFDSAGTPISFDVSTLWQGGPAFEGRGRSGLVASLGLFAGANAGIEMLGMLGTLLGAVVVGPAVLGVALVFGGKEVVNERRRQLADRRQQARTFLGSFVEEVRFEADGRLASLLDEIQRQMRARFAERIGELHRTFTESAAALERAADREEADRRVRLAEVRAALATIDDLGTRVASLAPGGA